MHFYTQDVKVEGFNVILRWKGRGTNESEYLGYEASGEEMLFHGVTVSCIKHGNEKIVSQWHYYSLGTLLRRHVLTSFSYVFTNQNLTSSILTGS